MDFHNYLMLLIHYDNEIIIYLQIIAKYLHYKKLTIEQVDNLIIQIINKLMKLSKIKTYKL